MSTETLVPNTTKCPICDGTGEMYRTAMDNRSMIRDCCWNCGGAGRVEHPEPPHTNLSVNLL